MYSSYYASKNQHQTETVKQNKAIKATPQYLFLNMVRIFSIAYLLLTIFYIPVYIGIGQIHSVYFFEANRQYSYIERILLQGTIFGIRDHKACYPKVGQDSLKNLSNQTLMTSGLKFETEAEVCYIKKFQFLPFIETVEEFHKFYLYYFIFFYFFTFLTVIVIERLNQMLYIQMEYPKLGATMNSKLQAKKILHLASNHSLPIYMLKPLLVQNLQKILLIHDVKNVKLCISPLFQQYAELHIKLKEIQTEIQQKAIQQKDERSSDIFDDKKVQIMELKKAQMMELKEQIQKIQFNQSILQSKILQKQRKNPFYHHNHFWIHFSSFQDALKVRTLIASQITQRKHSKCCQQHQFILKLDDIEFANIIRENICSQKLITLNKQSKAEFVPNNNYIVFEKIVQAAKITGGVLLCLVIIVLIDFLILMIQKSNIFSYATVLVVLLIEIFLKIMILKLTQLQRHWLHTHYKLSIMLKLILFIFFNLVIMLLIGNHNLGTWKLGQILSTYEFSSINQDWFLKIGTLILIVVIIQIFYCNIRVYIEVLKNIIFMFFKKRLSSMIKVHKTKEKMKFWKEDLRKNFIKPVMDLEICYSQIMPIYMLGISFSYLFPILYPLMFIFSITIYHSHKNYIELYTQKVPFSKQILNDWALSIIYLTFIGGLLFLYFVEEVADMLLILAVSLFMVLLLIFKKIFWNTESLVVKRMEMLIRAQKSKKRKDILKEEFTQRMFIDDQKADQIQREVQTHLNESSDCSWVRKEIKQKEIQMALSDLFLEDSRNINQIHAQYHAQYRKTLSQEYEFLKKLLTQCSQFH